MSSPYTDSAGFKCAKRTGPGREWVVVFDAVRGERDPVDDQRWITLCVAHRHEAGHPTQKAARAAMQAGSVTFCPQCNGGRMDATQPNLSTAEDLPPVGSTAPVKPASGKFTCITCGDKTPWDKRCVSKRSREAGPGEYECPQCVYDEILRKYHELGSLEKQPKTRGRRIVHV